VGEEVWALEKTRTKIQGSLVFIDMGVLVTLEYQNKRMIKIDEDMLKKKQTILSDKERWEKSII